MQESGNRQQEEEKTPLDDDEEETDLKKPKKRQSGQVSKEDKVIMDLNPSKFDKKDHIFMDFFSMYGKSFIDTKKGNDKTAQS